MNRSLQDRVYIVTGGSKGFGLAIARALVAEGAKVGLLSRNRQALDEAVGSLGAGNAFGIAADVARSAEVRAAFAGIVAHFGRLDGLINNAGVARPGPVEGLVDDEVAMQVNTNLLGTIFCCQAAIPLLRGVENARIVNMSSASAWHVDEMCQLSVYAASKAAVERFTRDLRTELQPDGIGVTCIRPGAAWTNFTEGWDPLKLKTAIDVWHNAGPYMDSGMECEHVAAAVVYALAQPPGVAVDLLEVRPNQRIDKLRL